MSKKTRRGRLDGQLKAKVALEALRNEATIGGSTDQTEYGLPRSLTYRWPATSSIRSRSWTGAGATSWRGGCRTRWTPRSVSKPSKTLCGGAARDLQQPTRGCNSPVRRSAASRPRQDQHGRPRALVGQRFRRAAVAQLEVRRGSSEGLCQRSRSAYQHRPVVPLLQQQPAAPSFGFQDPGGGVGGRSEPCGFAAALGRC